MEPMQVWVPPCSVLGIVLQFLKGDRKVKPYTKVTLQNENRQFPK